MLEEAVQQYQSDLALDDGAAQYLTSTEEIQTPDGRTVRGRGLSEETVDSSRVGVVSDPHPGHERYRGMLCIPYLGHDGRVLTVRFRRAQWRTDSGPKYLSLTDDPPRIYGIADIHKASDTIDVAEGEFDKLILNQAGLFSVAIPGAAMWNGVFRRMLAGFNRIRLWSDPDEAGAELTRKVMASMRQAEPMRLPRGTDVNDLYLQGGAEALHQIIEEA